MYAFRVVLFSQLQGTNSFDGLSGFSKLSWNFPEVSRTHEAEKNIFKDFSTVSLAQHAPRGLYPLHAVNNNYLSSFPGLAAP